MDKVKESNLSGYPFRIKSQNVTDLVQSCVLPYGKTFHAFLCFSNEDRQFASKLFETLESLGLKICFHERDFIPGRSIFDNISTAIKDSFKSILILSPRFNTSQWCKYEAELTVSFGIEMNQSKMLIPLLYEDVDEMPDFLKTFSVIDARQDDDVWFTDLLIALSASPKKLDKIEIPALPENYENHLLLVYHPDDKEFASKECGFLSEDDDSLICCHFPVDLEQVTLLSYINYFVNLLKNTLKVAIVISSCFEAEKSCFYLCNLILMAHNDLGKPSCNIIPLLLGDSRTTVPPCLSDITYLTVASGDEGWKKRLLTASCLTQTLHHKPVATTKDEQSIIRVSEFTPTAAGDRKPCRILDVLFIEDNLVIADSNNLNLKLYTVTGQLMDEMFFDTYPYPLTRISSNRVGVVLRSSQEVGVVEVSAKLQLIQKVQFKNSVSCAAATNENTFIISTVSVPSALYEGSSTGEILREVVPIDVTSSSSKKVRFMECNEEYIVTADDQRRQISVYTRDGDLIMRSPAYMQEAYVIRGVTLRGDVVYVVADNAVKYFSIRKEKTVIKTLKLQEYIKDFQNTKFTRCIDLDSTGCFMVLSQANEQSEFIRVLKMK